MKELFRFTKGERIASLILLVLTVLGTGLLFWVRRDRVACPGEFREFDSLVHSVVPEKNILRGKPETFERKARPVSMHEEGMSLSTHDPNKMTEKDWQQLGLSRHLITTIFHYREAGGMFRKKEDLKKIYGLSDSCYNGIAGFLEVPPPGERVSAKKEGADAPSEHQQKSHTETIQGKIKIVPSREILEINRADSADFCGFDGVSPVLARRIIRYRTLLGGYAKKEQLLEVYGLNKQIYRNMKGRITVNQAEIRKIDVNSCQEETLIRHPYLSPYEAKAILFYRKKYKHIDSLDVLLKKKVIQEKTFQRILPYLTVRNH